jgi:hypothetical protein
LFRFVGVDQKYSSHESTIDSFLGRISRIIVSRQFLTAS